MSYAALGYYDRRAFDLDQPDCEALLDSAAATLDALREDGNRRGIPARGGSPALAARRGVFVSLHRGPELLGCIGNLYGTLPLAEEWGGWRFRRRWRTRVSVPRRSRLGGWISRFRC